MKSNLKQCATVLALSGILLASACKKNFNDHVDTANANNFLVKEGMLSFKSQEDFNALVKHLNQLSLKNVDAELVNFKFNSLAKDSLNDEKIADVMDPVIRRLLNNQGAINIGSKIYLISGNKEFTIKNANFDVYKALKVNLNSEFRNDTSVVTEKIILHGKLDVKTDGKNLQIMSLDKGIGKPNTLSYLSGGTQENYSNEYDNGRPERVKIFAWAENYTFSSSCGVSLIGQAYRKGGAFGGRSWREDTMYYSRIYGSYTITHYGIFSNSFDTGAQSMISECRNTFSSGSSGLTPVINTLSATYEWRKAPQNPQESFYKNF